MNTHGEVSFELDLEWPHSRCKNRYWDGGGRPKERLKEQWPCPRTRSLQSATAKKQTEKLSPAQESNLSVLPLWDFLPYFLLVEYCWRESTLSRDTAGKAWSKGKAAVNYGMTWFPCTLSTWLLALLLPVIPLTEMAASLFGKSHNVRRHSSTQWEGKGARTSYCALLLASVFWKTVHHFPTPCPHTSQIQATSLFLQSSPTLNK